MSATLFDLTYWTARELPRSAVKEGTATGGSVSTLVDTNDRKEADHYWRGGTIWVLRDSAGAGAAPEKEYGIVSAFANSTSTLTLRSAVTAAIASGDTYAVCRKRFPLPTLIQKINQALIDMGPMPITNITTITTATDQSEYSLPIAANLDLREVWMQTNLNDTNDYMWQRRYDWYKYASATGTADILTFQAPIPVGYLCKLVYMDHHPRLNVYSDKLSEHVSPERVIYKAAAMVLTDRNINGDYNGDIARLEARALDAARMHPIDIPLASPKYLIAQRNSELNYEDEPNKVYLR